MRLRRINIIRAGGIFADQTLLLDGDLFIIGGANGSGKTTLLKIFRNLLFGFPSGLFKDYPDPGAPEVICQIDSTAGSFRMTPQGGGPKRRKTIFAPAEGSSAFFDDRTNQALLAEISGGITAEDYSALFAIGLDDLAPPDDGKGMSLLVSAGLKEAGLLALVAGRFRKAADELGASKGEKGSIGSLLDEIRTQRGILRESRIDENSYYDKLERLTRIDAELEKMAREEATRRAAALRLRELAFLVPDLERLARWERMMEDSGNRAILETLDSMELDRLAVLIARHDALRLRLEERCAALEKASAETVRPDLDALCAKTEEIERWGRRAEWLTTTIETLIARRIESAEIERDLRRDPASDRLALEKLLEKGGPERGRLALAAVRRSLAGLRRAEHARLKSEWDLKEARRRKAEAAAGKQGVESRLADWMKESEGLTAERAALASRGIGNGIVVGSAGSLLAFILLLALAWRIESLFTRAVLLAFGLLAVLIPLIAIGIVRRWHADRLRDLMRRGDECRGRRGVLSTEAASAESAFRMATDEEAAEEAVLARVTEECRSLRSALDEALLEIGLSPGMDEQTIESALVEAERLIAGAAELEKMRSTLDDDCRRLADELAKLDELLRIVAPDARGVDQEGEDLLASGKSRVAYLERCLMIVRIAREHRALAGEAEGLVAEITSILAPAAASFFPEERTDPLERGRLVLGERTRYESLRQESNVAAMARSRLLERLRRPETVKSLFGVDAGKSAEELLPELRRLLAEAGGAAGAERAVREADRRLEEQQALIREKEKDRARTEDEIRRLNTLEKRDLALAAIVERRQTLAGLVARYGRLRIGARLLEEAAVILKNEFEPALRADADRILARMTVGRLSGAEPSSDGRSFNIVDAVRGGVKMNAATLNRGASDQLHLAARLHRILERAPLPVILDDSTVNFDRFALDGAATILIETLKGRNQLFVLTCHPEVVMAFARHGRTGQAKAQFWHLAEGRLREILADETPDPAAELARRLSHPDDVTAEGVRL